jgi:signal transduction histidine kinase
LASHLEITWRMYKKALTRLRQILESGEKLARAHFAEIVTAQRRINAIIAEIKKRLRAQAYVDANAVIAEFIQQRDHVEIHFTAMPNLPRAYVATADLVHMLDELVSNASSQIREHPAQIDISLRHKFDELHIDVRDNGNGMPEHLWEKIFQLGFTTRPDGKGGFGLYHARQRLEKYGGKIFVAASEMGKGTTMRICLQAEIRLENEV